NVVSIVLPPLRERTTDVPRLVSFFLSRHAGGPGKEVRGIERRALAVLMAYSWPGNVRQLESVIESAILMTDGPTIRLQDLPQEVRHPGSAGPLFVDIPDTGISFEALERSLLEQALGKGGGNVSRAARLLGMTRRTFQYRLRKFGLGKADMEGGADTGETRADSGLLEP